MSKTDDDNRFNYQLLGRLQQDCDYYLGLGNRAKKHLWAGDEAEQIRKMRELYDGLAEKPEWITLEAIERYEAEMLSEIPAPAAGGSASDYYNANSSRCSALLGRYLFEDLRLVEADFASKETLHFCSGDRQWTAVEGGMEAMIREVRREVELNDLAGLRGSDLPEDWGVIANDAGQVLARASHTGGVCKQRFLGVDGGPIESGPITVQRIGIAWSPRDSATERFARQRG